MRGARARLRGYIHWYAMMMIVRRYERLYARMREQVKVQVFDVMRGHILWD